ncbi:29675_t:CDS:2, partial [Gigaspora margarita]
MSSLIPDDKRAIHGIVDIDYKKRSESESATFNFHITKVSAYGVENNILEEIHKFPFQFQNLLVKKTCAVVNRIEKGKVPQVQPLLIVTACFIIDTYCH